MRIVVKVPVIESEKNWGSKVDDYMLCLSKEDADNFRIKFNAKNDKPEPPSWYMYADSEYGMQEITDIQFEYLNKSTDKRMCLSSLKSFK